MTDDEIKNVIKKYVHEYLAAHMEEANQRWADDAKRHAEFVKSQTIIMQMLRDLQMRWGIEPDTQKPPTRQ